MSRKSTNNKYGTVAIAIHWLTAILILLLLCSGLVSSESDSPTIKTLVLRLHVPLGLLLLLLTVVRIGWWCFADKKPTPMPVWQDRLSRAVHLLLYLAIIGMSTSGIGMMVLSGAGPYIFGGDPTLLPDFWDYLPRTPHGVVARILFALLMLHVGAALYHHFVLRDGLLGRMWFRNVAMEKEIMSIPTLAPTLILGLLSGALLLLATGLVPYWQSLDPNPVTPIFKEQSQFIAAAMMPLGFAAAGVTWLATLFALWKKHESRYWLIAASVCALCMLTTFLLYFKETNSALASGSIAVADIPDVLSTWGFVHWMRTIAAILGCLCAIKAVQK